jgi:hypothetical protein
MRGQVGSISAKLEIRRQVSSISAKLEMKDRLVVFQLNLMTI